MVNEMSKLFSDADIEILPPQPVTEGELAVCACCCRHLPNWVMDEDGCGICDECLAP
ncbi:hypothetical protein GGE35_005633 [Rhizobium cellulosilyticum]|jgi:hypothetical protein|uniref:Uncharacterized protein n=1 Tax=Aliirhizobium cellulosilyticum TaxID=393664 RepID=A0A7W6SDN5_9HYPH|nr:hypothetical protein [Rhizobium cellulosilyticum]MBB4415074.1 hypothetical protein [Rhizobium cellulosilyticum]MBB4449766.1 hypothetical protein [Rhizobium cellulosilyticum]